MKFGPNGTYSATADGPFRDNTATKACVERYDDARLEYFASVLDSVEQRFGTFTGRIPTALVSVFFQAQHADLGFYDTFYQPDTITTPMRDHDTEWHNQQEAEAGNE